MRNNSKEKQKNKMKTLLNLLIISTLAVSSFAQSMGINVPTALAPLHVSSKHVNPETIIIRADGDDPASVQIVVNATNPTATPAYSMFKAGFFVAQMGVNTTNDFFIKVGGNATGAIYAKNSNNFVGINNAAPLANLDVNGTTIIGTNGSVLNNIIKVSVTADVPAIPASGTVVQTFSVPNAVLGSAVGISPDLALPTYVIMQNVRVSAANTVSVTFRNITNGGVQDPVSMAYHITVIQ